MARVRSVTLPRRAGGRGRFLVPTLAALGVCVLLVAAVLVYAYLRHPAAPRPLVLIRSPGEGQQVQVGELVSLHAIARGQERVVRLELWVDGQLQEVQQSSLPEGSSPFPLVAGWQPAAPGPHTVTARAFDARGRRAHSSVSVQAMAEADRDGDGVADAADACPDEAGWAGAQGCPDADGDAVPDAKDPCPGEAGPPDGDGCPAITEGDRDGDGVLDDADACPDEPGWAPAQGCPDADRDGLADVRDACPGEPGLAEDGCPPPADGEGDATPAVADADGDGVADDRDLCPEAAGPADAGGCPPSEAGDRDGDGLADDVDLAPAEPGLPEHGGSPPPDADGDHDGVPDEEEPPATPWTFSGLLLRSIQILLPPPPPPDATLVELQAAELRTHQAYDRVVCYACLQGQPVERVDLEYVDGMLWQLPSEYAADAHVQVPVPPAQPFTMTIECGATRSGSAESPEGTPEGSFSEGGDDESYYDLGSLAASNDGEEWDGRRLYAQSVSPDPAAPGRVFHIVYRLCEGSCEESALPAPSLGLYDRGGDHALGWTWDGDPGAIDGFFVRCNCDRTGFFTRWAPKDWRILPVSDLEPDCGRTCSFTVSARRNSDGVESPASNAAVWEGDPCPGYLYVNFGGVRSHSHCESGPIYGVLWANEEVLWFDAADEFWGMESLSAGLGFPHRDVFGGCSLDIQDFFDAIRGLDPGWVDSYTAPASSRVCLLMRPYTDLNIGVRIYEDNPDGDDPVLAEGSATIPAAHLMGEDLNHSYGGDPYERLSRTGDVYFLGYDSDGSPFYALVHSDGMLTFDMYWSPRPQAP